ncbi:MAG: HAD family hydrolase [Woeseiaceae bacterium]
MHSRSPLGVLFDLDGTLIDTADDLVAALFASCDMHQQARPDANAARKRVAYGGLGLIELAFGTREGATANAALDTLLTHYQRNIAVHSRLYDTLDLLLIEFGHAGIPWGIVTNKNIGLTTDLLAALNLKDDVHIVVGADSLPVRKPDPAPLLYAAGAIGVLPQDCIYIGDHERDMVAAKAAHMKCIGATYGYIDTGDNPSSWPADLLVSGPGDVRSALISLGVPLEAASSG